MSVLDPMLSGLPLTIMWLGASIFLVLTLTNLKKGDCAHCNKAVYRGEPQVLDSYYGLQYLCSTKCWDSYEGWWCKVCMYLHDNDTTMEGDDSCIE